MALDTTSLILTVSDNLNGTVNWSLSGCGAGQNVALFKAPWNTQAGGRCDWTQMATATANGSGVASGTNLSAGGYGFYLWSAVRQPTSTTADRLSGLVYRPVVDPTAIIHDRILDAFVTAIQSLNLSGIGSGNGVKKRWFPEYLTGFDSPSSAVGGTAGTGHGLPMCQVSPYPKELPMGLLNATDDIGYPVLVAFFDKAEPTLDNNIPRGLKWRRQVAAYFRSQQLAGVPEVVLVHSLPDSIVATDWLKGNFIAGAIGFNVQARETRGLVA